MHFSQAELGAQHVPAHLHGGGYDQLSQAEAVAGEAVSPEAQLHQAGEDPHHGAVAEGVDAQRAEVAQQARRHRVPPTTGGPHGGHQLHVHQAELGGVLQVVPVVRVVVLESGLGLETNFSMTRSRLGLDCYRTRS